MDSSRFSSTGASSTTLPLTTLRSSDRGDQAELGPGRVRTLPSPQPLPREERGRRDAGQRRPRRRWRGEAALWARPGADRSPRALPPSGPQVTTWPGPISYGRAGRETPRKQSRTLPQRHLGIRGQGLRARDPFPGPARTGGGKTRPWLPASPSPPPRRGRRAPAPPLVAAARLGAARSGLELRAGSLRPRPMSGPGSGAADGGTPATYPPADAIPARAVHPPRSCQSCGHEKREPRSRALTAPLGRRRPGRTKAAHRGRRLLLPRPRGSRDPRYARRKIVATERGCRRRGGWRGGLGAAGNGSGLPRAMDAPGAGSALVQKPRRNRGVLPLSRCRRPAAAMIIPVRCFTCGKIVGNKWEAYLGLLQAEYTEGYGARSGGGEGGLQRGREASLGRPARQGQTPAGRGSRPAGRGGRRHSHPVSGDPGGAFCPRVSVSPALRRTLPPAV